MSRKRKSNQKSNPKTGASLLSCLNLNAAGIDVGATEIYIAVPGDRDPQPVRCFPTFTEDLHAAAAWLKACHIETVALAGERNPHTLAALRDRRIKASADTIAKSLVGDYRREHLFTLRQSLAAFRHYQSLPRVDRGLRSRNCAVSGAVRVARRSALSFPIALERRVQTEGE
jgi:hypothetical protein